MHERTRVDRHRDGADGRDDEIEQGNKRPAVVPPRTLRRTALVVGPADDAFEREADRLADLVVSGALARRMTTADARVESSSGGGETPIEAAPPAMPSRIRRAPVVGAEGGALDAPTEQAVNAARTGGSRIRRGVEQRIGDALGADLHDVRLHTGRQAADLNRQMQASAFTIGNDIFFRDGLPNTSTSGGMHLLAHEVAHTVQQGGSTVGRRTVRRKLVPKAANAFTAALAANPSFATGQKDTDDLAAEADQEDLTRVHGRMHTGQDSADAQKVAHMVRAVVLSEYSARLRALETAVGKTGQPLTAKEKAVKKSVYKTKADEFRKMQIPLVAKGSQAPETLGFLREHGLESAFGPTGPTASPGQLARLDVRSTFIGAKILGQRVRAHLFIVYTAKDGRQMYFRGGPDEDDFTVADMGDYAPGGTDWDPSAPSVTLLEGAAAEAKLDALIEATSVIDGMKVPYRGAIAKEFGGANPNAVEDLLSTAAMGLSSEGENCNATAWTILTRAGITKKKKPSGRHPGWGSILGSKTAGKENALPPTEAPKMGKPYVVDESRETADDSGAITVFRDRMLFDPMTTVQTGTKVMLYDETTSWRQVGINGKIGYVPRRTRDAVYDLLPGWLEALRDNYSDALIQQIVAQGDNPAVLKKVNKDTGIPRDYVVYTAKMAVSPNGDIAQLLFLRLELLGKPHIRELLDNPQEVARLAANLGADPQDVADVATQIVGVVEKEAKVPAILLKHLNDPNAANMAMNQFPAYPALNAVATEMGESFDWVAGMVDGLRPTDNRGNYFETMLNADPLAQGELPNVAEYMLKGWAAKTGVTVDFLKQRCAEVHQANELEKARLQAEATAKAEAEALAKAKRKANKKKQQRNKKAQQGKGAQPTAPEQQKVPDKAPPRLDDNQTRIVGQELIRLNLSDDAIWLLVNDVPKWTELKQVAKDSAVSLQDVIDVAVAFFKGHKGSTQLITMLEKMAESTARRFADGTGYPQDYKKLEDMTGLDRATLIEKIAAWVEHKYG